MLNCNVEDARHTLKDSLGIVDSPMATIHRNMTKHLPPSTKNTLYNASTAYFDRYLVGSENAKNQNSTEKKYHQN